MVEPAYPRPLAGLCLLVTIALLGSCSHLPTSGIRGRLLVRISVGPAPGLSPHPTRGQVTVRRSDRTSVDDFQSTRIGRSGNFELVLSPGTYDVTFIRWKFPRAGPKVIAHVRVLPGRFTTLRVVLKAVLY
jgi:hypothetical protein